MRMTHTDELSYLSQQCLTSPTSPFIMFTMKLTYDPLWDIKKKKKLKKTELCERAGLSRVYYQSETFVYFPFDGSVRLLSFAFHAGQKEDSIWQALEIT